MTLPITFPKPTAWLLVGLCLVLGLQSCNLAEEESNSPNNAWNTTPANRNWRLDFESGLPRTDIYSNGTTHSVVRELNHNQPLSGGSDLKLTAVLNGTNREGWAGVWVKDPSDLDINASGAIGLRFKLRASTARTIQVSLSSMAYPDFQNGAKRTATYAATKGTQNVELKFTDFVYPVWLYRSGEFCGTPQGAQTYCTVAMPEVLARVNAIQFQMDPRWDSTGTVEDDWSSIQIDDIQFVFP